MTDRRTDQERELDRWARRDDRRPAGRVSAPRGWSAAESREIVPALRRRFDRLPWVEAARDPEWREQTLRDLLCRSGLDLGRVCDALGEGLAARDEAARTAERHPAAMGAADGERDRVWKQLRDALEDARAWYERHGRRPLGAQEGYVAVTALLARMESGTADALLLPAVSRRRPGPPPRWIGDVHAKMREAGATRAQANALLHGLGLLPLDRGRPPASP